MSSKEPGSTFQGGPRVKFQILALAAIAALLPACGGGGGTSSPPTSAPQSHKVGFTATALGSGSGTDSIGRKHADATCPSNPTSIALQAIPPSAPTGNWSIWESGSEVAAVEYDANCNVISSSPTYSLASSTIASTTFPSWYASYITAAPSGGVNLAGLEPGATTLTATFPDATTAGVAVDVYGTAGVACDGENVYDGTTSGSSSPQWSASLGYAVIPNPGTFCGQTSTDSPQAAVDMQVSGSEISFPYGYDIISTSSSPPAGPSPLVGVTSCSGFTSEGTLMPMPAAGTYITVIEFMTSTAGVCVKLSPQVQTIGSGPDLLGYYAVSNSSGAFAY
jgi:hypothetical protein